MQEVNSNVVKNAALHKGYLPYTANNVLRGAFKYYNAPYNWGGAHKGIDDASFIANVYRTMGIFLPRNADEQENTSGSAVKFAGMTSDQRLEAINKI